MTGLDSGSTPNFEVSDVAKWPSWQKRGLYPLLLAIYPLTHLYAANASQLYVRWLAVPLFLSLLVGLLALLATRASFPDPAAGRITASVLLLVLVLTRHLLGVMEAVVHRLGVPRGATISTALLVGSNDRSLCLAEKVGVRPAFDRPGRPAFRGYSAYGRRSIGARRGRLRPHAQGPGVPPLRANDLHRVSPTRPLLRPSCTLARRVRAS